MLRLIGTCIGIPVAFGLTERSAPFAWFRKRLGTVAPCVSAGVWLDGVVFWDHPILQSAVEFTHLRVKLEETELTSKRLVDCGERVNLTGL